MLLAVYFIAHMASCGLFETIFVTLAAVSHQPPALKWTFILFRLLWLLVAYVVGYVPKTKEFILMGKSERHILVLTNQDP